MDHGGPCVPVNRFRGMRLATLKKGDSHIANTADTVQFDPTSRLVTPGAIGGNFSARTQVLSVTLPSLHNDYYIPNRGFRKQAVSSNRFVPTETHWTPSTNMTPRDRLRVEEELLEMAKKRSHTSRRVVPHRSEQPYLMAGFPVKLQERSLTCPELMSLRNNKLAKLSTPSNIFPPNCSLVNEYSDLAGDLRDTKHPSHFSLPGQNINDSATSEAFLTQTTLDPIIMEDITVTKSHSYRSPCSLLGKDLILSLTRDFRKVSLQSDTLSYSLAEQLVPNAPDPSQAVQTLDLNKDGLVDIKEYIIVMSIARHHYQLKPVDHVKFDNKLKSLRLRFDELEKPTIANCINSNSRLLISDSLMGGILNLVNCNPTVTLSFKEFLCLFKFWDELEEALFEEDVSGESEVDGFITNYLGDTDSTYSFDDIISSTYL